jgi:hypothetical protein
MASHDFTVEMCRRHPDPRFQMKPSEWPLSAV